MRFFFFFSKRHGSLLAMIMGILWSSGVVIQAVNHHHDDDTSSSSSSSFCSTVYLAKSSIREAGWGIFAARDYQVGDTIGPATIGIPFLDLAVEHGDTTFLYGGLSEYLWESANIGGFGEALKVDVFLPGPASLVNHHAALANVLPVGLHHDTQFHRESNPMAGSFTAYHTNDQKNPEKNSAAAAAGASLIAIQPIAKGDELFIDRTSSSSFFVPSAYYEELPSKQDYAIVDELVQSLQEQQQLLTEAQFQDLLHRVATELIPASGYEDDPVQQTTLLQALVPRSGREFQACLQHGSAKYRFVPPKTIPQLEQEGHCMDTIHMGPSQIPHAGQGAFSTRFLSKGSVVSRAPLVTVAQGHPAMGVPFTSLETTPPIPDDAAVQVGGKTYLPQIRHTNATQQLLVNYCLGHDQSDILLCPTTLAVLMNHYQAISIMKDEEEDTNSDKNDDRTTPNVGMRWYHDPDLPDYEQWTLKSLEDLLAMDLQNPKTMQSRLTMDYIALRDIKEGEELVLDYSNSWQSTLEEHYLKQRNEVHGEACDAKLPSAKQWNDEGRAIRPSIEIRPLGLAYFCQIFPNMKINEDPDWEEFSANMAVNQSSWPPEMKHAYQENEFASLYPCIVVEESSRSTSSDQYYHVEVLVKPLSLSRVGRRFLNVPRHRIRFADSLYRSDMHLGSAFRHHVGLPDEIFPMQWRRDYWTAQDFRLGRHEGNAKLTQAQADSYERSLRESSCGLYIAPSNIPGAGLGVYTGVNLPEAGIAITTLLPVIPSLGKPNRQKWMGQDYIWSARGFYVAASEGWPRFGAEFISFLFGALANAHAGINNIGFDMGEWDPTLDGSTDYGAGAFTDYVKTAFRSLYPIQAGEELFVSYGEHWFRHRKEFRSVPLSENYKRANYMIASLWAYLSINGLADSSAFWEAFLPIILGKIMHPQDVRTMSVLKEVQSMEDIQHVMARNGTAEATVQARSKDWLDQNGYCLDHIYVADSTIPQAGQGAFSRRHLAKNSIIIASPALVTPRSVLYTNLSHVPEVSNELHLMANYHYGHKDSSVLFFPLVTSAFINHASNGRTPNARVEFSTTDARSLYFQSLHLEDLLEQKYSTVMMDFVATQDIQPDEEILIDYGIEWEKAWDAHVTAWRSPCESGSPDPTCFASSKRIKAMNDDKFNREYHAWSDHHVATCHYNESLIEEYGEIYFLVPDIPTKFDQAVDPTIGLEYQGITYHHEGFGLPRFQADRPRHDGVVCQIIESSSEEDWFDVVYFMGDSKDLENAKGIWRIRSLPSSHLMFHVRPFHSDMMRPGAFRHEIAFPDDKFPSLWKDMI